MTATELERKVQQAAEARLAYCSEMLACEDDGEEMRAPGEDEEPCAPFCGCDTCVVREVLDAAWPHMLELARLEVAERPLSPA